MDFELISRWILYFAVYAVLGFVLEVSFCSLEHKKLVNRGYMFGPVIPIYGVGALLVIWMTEPVTEWPLAVFAISLLGCSTLEYLTSVILEKIYHVRWWDYAETTKIHLNGRVCLRSALVFGIGGCGIVYWLHDGLVAPLIVGLGTTLTEAAAGIFVFLFAADWCLSTYAALKSRKDFQFSQEMEDRTHEIKQACWRAVKELMGALKTGRKRRRRGR